MKDLNHFDKTKNVDDTLDADFYLNLSDELRTISYMLSCIGESVETSGIPSDRSIFNRSMSRLGDRLDDVADSLEYVAADLTAAADVLTIAVKEPGKDPVMIQSDGSLKSLQTLVKGYIEQVQLSDDMSIVCNESGRIQDLPENCTINNVTYYGSVLLVGTDPEGNCTSITKGQAAEVFG